MTPGRRKQVSLKDVSREANTSVATVSRVLNNIPGSVVSNEKRQLPETAELSWEQPAAGSPADSAAAVRLEPGGYLVTYNEEIRVPADSAGLVLPRSSLMRCGATLHSALWDPGYRGRGQGLLTVHRELTLYRNARVGQFVLLAIESAPPQLYDGQYQGENL